MKSFSRPVFTAVAVVVLGLLAGGTVFRDQIARAAQSVGADITSPLDGQGNVRVHDPGTVAVNVTNNRSGSEVLVHETGEPTMRVDGTVQTDSAERSAVVYSGGFCGIGEPRVVSVDTSFREIRIYFTNPDFDGTPVDLFVNIGATEAGPLFDQPAVPAIGRVTRTYDVPPPELTVSCPSDVASHFQPGTLDIYGWR
jgi:hypothetical protein